MKFILKLLERILESISGLYTSDQVDNLAGAKVDSESFNTALSAESEARISADEDLSNQIASAVSNQQALENVAEWQGYANAMQSIVDEDTAIQIAEEFEKAAQKYLENPEATKKWDTVQDAGGNITSSNPYYETPSTKPVVDFNVVSAVGVNNTTYSFNENMNVPIFLPRLNNGIYMLRASVKFDSPLYLPNATECEGVFCRCSVFNQTVRFPKAEKCGYLLYMATLFNKQISLPNATICSYMLYRAEAFNQILHLPNAINCLNMLYGATSFNQPLSLPKATNCSYMLNGATAFNSTLDLPKATNCSYMLANATSFNQPIDLPEATNVSALLQNVKAFNNSLTLPKAVWCSSILINCSKFNQAVSLPSCSLASWAFQNTAIDAQNISQTLDSLKDWSYDTSSQVHDIGFLNTPGSVSTATTETFTVTDDGTDYSFDYCPSFDTDDDNQSLRKSFVLAVMKKGWTVSMGHPIFHGEDGRGVYANGTMKSLAIALPNLTNAGDTEDNGMFYNCTELESISVLGLSKLKTARSMFHNCSKLKTLVGFPSSWDGLTSAGNLSNYGKYGMFSNTSLETTPDWTFPNLSNARAMFADCLYLTSVGKLSFPSLTDQAFYSFGVGLFNGCSSLIDISGLRGSFPKLTNWAGMFNGCKLLTDVSPILEQFVRNATIAFGTFASTGITEWSIDLPNLVNAAGLFYKCKSLVSVTGDFSSVGITGTSGVGMFYDCTVLETVDIELPSLSSGKSMFQSCVKLKLSCAEKILNSLPEWTDGEEHIITFSNCIAAINAGLNGDNAAVINAVAKGWTVEL